MKHPKKSPTEQQLQAYLAGTLSVEEQQQLELQMEEDALYQDAIEGLSTMEPADITASANRIKDQFQNQIAKELRHKHHDKRRPGLGIWMIVLLVLLLCVLGFWVLSMM